MRQIETQVKEAVKMSNKKRSTRTTINLTELIISGLIDLLVGILIALISKRI